MISVCSSNYSNVTVIQNCREYSNPVVWAGKIFKNVECALCNDVLSTVPLATCAMIKLQGYTHTTQELDIAQMYFDSCYSYADSDFYALEYNSSQSTVPTFQDINFNCTDVTTLCLGNCLSTKRDVSHYRSGGRENRAPPTSPGHHTPPHTTEVPLPLTTSSAPNATDPTSVPFHNELQPAQTVPTDPLAATEAPVLPANPMQEGMTYMYTARPTYSLLFDLHSSGYDIIQGTTKVTTIIITEQCATGEVFLPGAGGGGHCVPVVTFQCYVTPNTASVVRTTSDGPQNSTLMCSYGFNTTSNYTCVQIAQNDTQYTLLQQNVGPINNLSGNGYIGNVSGGQVFKFSNTFLFCSNLSQQYSEDVLRNTTTFPHFATVFSLEILTYIGCSLSIIGSLVLLPSHTPF